MELNFKTVLLLVFLISLISVVLYSYPLGEDTWYHYAMIKNLPNVNRSPWNQNARNVQPPLFHIIIFAINKMGLDLFTIFRFLPLFISLFYVFSFYKLAYLFLKSEKEAATAALFASLAPGSFLVYPFPKYISIALLLFTLYLFITKDKKSILTFSLIAWISVLEFIFASFTLLLYSILKKELKSYTKLILFSLPLYLPWYAYILFCNISSNSMAFFSYIVLPHFYVVFFGPVIFLGLAGLFECKDKFLKLWFLIPFLCSLSFIFGYPFLSSRFLTFSIIPLSIIASNFFYRKLLPFTHENNRKIVYSLTVASIIIISIITHVSPVVSLDDERFEAIQWLSEQRPGIVLSDEADMKKVKALTGMKVLVGGFNINNTAQMRKDILNFFVTSDKSVRKAIVDKYNVSYVYVEKDRTSKWVSGYLHFLNLSECFEKNSLLSVFNCYKYYSLDLFRTLSRYSDYYLLKQSILNSLSNTSFLKAVYVNDSVIIYAVKQ
ncbi:hypothetical protein DRN74_05115 [Candidatus Micrarchaeota archaeon]|nr:MAG: hypothetical protein DRN74_05115 [Candidatus Micrarchaeota archaeon]